MKYYIKKYHNPSETLNEESPLIESTLPEVIIEPDKWQKEYIQYFPETLRKDIKGKYWLTEDNKKRYMMYGILMVDQRSMRVSLYLISQVLQIKKTACLGKCYV